MRLPIPPLALVALSRFFVFPPWLISIPRTVETVFQFFADPSNLEELTPPWLRFRILNPVPDVHTGQRVDYIFAHGIDPNRIRDAWAEHDRLARYASDHFPIGAEIA